MGVVYCLKRASDEELALLKNNPRLIGRFLFDDDDAYQASNSVGSKISNLFFRPAPSGSDVEFADREEIDLDKSWHVLHFLLTGLTGDGVHPLNLIGHDWPPLAKVDMGLGPPMMVRSADLRSFDEELSQVTDAEILDRWDSNAIRSSELYLGETLADDEETGREYVAENLAILRKFVSDCVAAGDGAVVYYT